MTQLATRDALAAIVFAAGFDAYLSKPTDPADLVSTVARLAEAASAPSAS